MYTTRIKRFFRSLKPNIDSNEDEKSILSFNNKIFYLIKTNNTNELIRQMENYIESIKYEKNKFSKEEKLILKECIRKILTKNKYKQVKLKKNKNYIKIISLSGFGYSGTGAIHDYLRDTDICIDMLDGRELDLYKYQFSFITLYLKSLSDKNFITQKDINKFIFSHIFGLPYPRGVTSDEINKRLVGSKSLFKAILRLPKDLERINLIKDICISINQINNINTYREKNIIIEIISKNIINCLGKYYKKKFPKKKYLIINNWIPASNINLINLLPNGSKSIICTRNAIDAYYSWKTECPRIKYNFNILILPYIFFYFMRHIDFSRNYKKIDKSRINDVHFIYFEEFIHKNLDLNGKKYYKKILKIKHPNNFDFKNFNPNKSKNNINIFINNKHSFFFKNIGIVLNNLFNLILKLKGYKNYYRNNFKTHRKIYNR